MSRPPTVPYRHYYEKTAFATAMYVLSIGFAAAICWAFGVDFVGTTLGGYPLFLCAIAIFFGGYFQGYRDRDQNR